MNAKTPLLFGTALAALCVLPLAAEAREHRAETVVITPAAATAPAATAAAPAAASTGEPDDVLEPLNRVVFGFNEGVEFLVLKPVNGVYRVLPRPVRDIIGNVVSNATSPVTFANDLLQGQWRHAHDTFFRFMINTTAGFGGMVDAAEAGGIHKHYEDFGQTLAVWGVGSGPYVVLPVLGPSSARDAVGTVVDFAFDPTTWLLMDSKTAVRMAPTGTYVVVNHDAVADDLDNMRKTSPDFYASVRDVYFQKRASDIANGDVSIDQLPSISGE